MHAWRRVLDALAVQRVQHDVSLQLDLMRVRDVLQLAATAGRHVRTRWRDAMWRRLEDAHHLGERRGALPVSDRDLDLLAGDAALDEHSRTLFVVGEAQSRRGPCAPGAPALLPREPFAQQAVHQRHVRLAAGRILDRAHQLAERLLLAGAEIGRGSGMFRDRRVDERAERLACR